MRNLDIRIMVSESGLRYIDIAKQMGISRVWLSNLMRYDLTPENRNKILKAIRELRKNTQKHRYHVGDKVYFAGYDDNFPDQSVVSEYEVTDASEKGLIRLFDGLWIDPNDPEEHMYPSREQAEEALQRLIAEGGK